MTLVVIGVLFSLLILKREEHYLLLSEVIPQGRIVSQEEGIVEYKGVYYILGTNDLQRKKSLIQFLDLLNLEDSFVVDLRFSRQVIVRVEKKGPRAEKQEPGSERPQSRRK